MAVTSSDSSHSSSDVGARGQRTVRAGHWWIRLFLVRFRFLLVLALALAIVGNWQWLTNVLDRWFSNQGIDPTRQGASSDREYFCPMDPGVRSDWPSKCSICNMALVPRKKGEAAILPSGVVARMQFSPYRIQLAGVQTTPIEYKPLVREVVALGQIVPSSGDSQRCVDLRLSHADLDLVSVDQAASADCTLHGVRHRWPGRVASVDAAAHNLQVNVRVELDAAEAAVNAETALTVRIQVSAASLEPFRSLPRAEPNGSPNAIREIYYCPDHPDVIRDRPAKCPIDKLPLEQRLLTEHQQVDYWCPMHPSVSAAEPGHECALCEGMRLVPRVRSFAPPGEVLALPESAVVDTGNQQVVYVERGHGMFDGVVVTLGPRCGSYYPVASGLTEGDRVVLTGAFLVDAEAKLNPSLAASYFGATGAATGKPDTKAHPQAAAPKLTAKESAKIKKALAGLSQRDRALAQRQGTCPVTGLALGSMGTPTQMMVSGRKVFLCCQGCEAALAKDPGKYLPQVAP